MSECKLCSLIILSSSVSYFNTMLVGKSFFSEAHLQYLRQSEKLFGHFISTISQNVGHIFIQRVTKVNQFGDSVPTIVSNTILKLGPERFKQSRSIKLRRFQDMLRSGYGCRLRVVFVVRRSTLKWRSSRWFGLGTVTSSTSFSIRSQNIAHRASLQLARCAISWLRSCRKFSRSASSTPGRKFGFAGPTSE